MAVLIVIGLVAFFTREREPEYNGKPLSYWVEMYSRLDPQISIEDEENAAEAIRAIGTNALPFLLEWTDYEPTKLDEWFGRNYNELPKWMTAPGPFQWRRRAYTLSVHANNAFIALGPIAEPAFPELRSRLDDPNFHRASLAFSSLMSIGPAAIPIAIKVISNPGTNIYRYRDSLSYLPALGTDDVVAVMPAVLKNLQHTNTDIAVATAQSLGYLMNYRFEGITSELTSGLSDPRVQVRRAILTAIMLHGDKSILPALTNALTDPDAQIRTSAKSAIDEISLEN